MKRPRPRRSLGRLLALGLPGAAGSRLREGGRGAEVVHLGSAIDGMLRGQQAHGDPRCPCVGLDGLVGRRTARVEGEEVEFPADLGGQCKAWDDGFHPRCEPGESAPWCGEAWCYVDPCNCDMPVAPTLSEYLPEGAYQGKPIHFSYATCDAVDAWTRGHARRPPVDVAATCSREQDEEVWGKRGCPCIGIGDGAGATEVQLGQNRVAYPAGLGARCEAWDQGRHPDCRGPGAGEWCARKWCYVDPCSCNLAVAPRGSSYLNGTTHLGRPLHYSYAACGNEDPRPDGDACAGLSRLVCEGGGVEAAARCRWDHAGGRCVSWGLPALCDPGHGARSSAARHGLLLVLLLALGGWVLPLLAP
ncbi:unnamed protein product [Prorocentrum cordatum]|uniref:Uncharacterized protein n=1 Tax=Prorocentrum cordatum TaxID=2364126 RepID=A0ABN9WWG9_9DINO|nr:unnamed protein product [Polarella glacialis]